MVATIDVYTDFGGANDAPGTEQDTDGLGPPNIRFKYADNNTIDLNDPIPIPAAGTNRSRWKHIYMFCAVAPDTQIDNVKVYTDGGGFGTGITVNVGDGTQTKTDASSAGYEVSDTADEVLTGHADIAAVTDFFTFTSGSPRTVSISESGSVIDAVNETTDYIVLSMEVINTASPGDLADETITYEYDEI